MFQPRCAARAVTLAIFPQFAGYVKQFLEFILSSFSFWLQILIGI